MGGPGAAVLCAYARRGEQIDRMILACFVPGLSTRTPARSARRCSWGGRSAPITPFWKADRPVSTAWFFGWHKTCARSPEHYRCGFSRASKPTGLNEGGSQHRRILRAHYRVQNWPEYDRVLQRGSLTVWVTPEALAAWQPPRTGQRGRPWDYSDVAIEIGHLLRLAFGRS
jgi:hypothetical protein